MERSLPAAADVLLQLAAEFEEEGSGDVFVAKPGNPWGQAIPDLLNVEPVVDVLRDCENCLTGEDVVQLPTHRTRAAIWSVQSHLRALAACLQSEVFASYSLTRVIVEAAARTFWLYHPDANAETMLHRALHAFREDAREEVLYMEAVLSRGTHAADSTEANGLRQAVALLRCQKECVENLIDTLPGGTGRSTPTDVTADLMNWMNNSRPGWSMAPGVAYRLLSANIHSQAHGIYGRLKPIAGTVCDGSPLSAHASTRVLPALLAAAASAEMLRALHRYWDFPCDTNSADALVNEMLGIYAHSGL